MPGAPFRILHLSDLHFGTECFFFNSQTAPADWARMLADDLELGLAQNGMRDTAMKAPGKRLFDLLVISGDLAHKTQQPGMRAAERFCEEVQGSENNAPRWWAADDILLVPGNHDFDFGDKPAQGAEGPIMLLNLPSQERQKPFRQVYRNINKKELKSHAWLGLVQVFSHHRLTIIGLDSCRLESWQAPGMGFVGLDQVISLAELADDKERDERQISADAHAAPWHRLAFVHHHLEGRRESDSVTMAILPEKAAGTFTWDARHVVWAAEQYGIDFILHGHRHCPDMRLAENAGKVFGRVMGAGSVAVSAMSCGWKHHFYVLEVGSTVEVPDAETSRSLSVTSFVRPLQNGLAGAWEIDDRRNFVLSSQPPVMDARTALSMKPLAFEEQSFCQAFEDWPLARLFLTEQDRDQAIWDDQLSHISDSCELIWAELRTVDSDLPEWRKAMTLLFRRVRIRETGVAWLNEFEQFLNGGKRRSLRDFLIRKALDDPELPKAGRSRR